MKRIFKFGIIIVTLSFLCGCFGHQSPRYVKLARKITEKTAKKLEERKKLYLIGTGGGMMHDIQMMAMSFDFYQEVDLQIARELIVYTIREYLSDINNNEEVRPYLHNYPFTAKNVEIRIWFWNPDRTDLPLDKIQCVSTINGILSYYLDTPDKYSYQKIHSETYEEALAQMNNEVDP